MKQLLLWLSLFIGLTVASSTEASPFKTIKWTNPCLNAALDDSGHTYCTGPDQQDTCKDLSEIIIYGYSNTGTVGWKEVKRINVMGRYCMADSFQFDMVYNWAWWNIYLVPTDMSNNKGCASSVLFLGTAVTSVEPIDVKQLKKTYIFDVQGRKVNEVKGSGIYFKVFEWSDGSRTTRKFVHLK